MMVGIHKSGYAKRSKYLKRYEAVLDYNGIKNVSLDASEPGFWQQVSQLGLFIYRWGHNDYDHQMALTVIPIAENIMGVKCFPNMATCWCYDDKIKEYFLLRQKDFPVIQSWVFWEKNLAFKWLETANLPVVFKLKGGAGSSNVVLVEDKATAGRLIKRMFGRGIKSGKIPLRGAKVRKEFNLYRKACRWCGDICRKWKKEDISYVWQRHKNYIFFQKYLPNNDFDTRVVIVGDRAFAFRRFNREQDFRASGSGMVDHNADKIDLRCIESAFTVSKSFNFQAMAYDFIFDENRNPAIIEISYACPDKNIFKCGGYWDSELNWHQGHYWPQYLHLVDALNLPDLKQPQISCE